MCCRHSARDRADETANCRAEKELKQAQENELNGKGADTVTIRKYDDRLAEINKELDYIGKSRPQVLYYERDKEELFDKEPATRSRKKELDAKLVALDERFALKRRSCRFRKRGGRASRADWQRIALIGGRVE